MSAQPSPVAFTAIEARRARVSYQHVAHIVNRILNRIAQGLSEEDAGAFKPSVFQTIHSLHGFFNGREVSKKKAVIKAHKFVIVHFEYGGDRDNAANVSKFMDRRLDALREAEYACEHSFIPITRADGQTLLYTSYEGHPLLDAAEWVYLMARSKPDYWTNPGAAITDDLLDNAIAKLPPVTRPVKQKPDAAKLETLEQRLEDFIADAHASGDMVSRDDAIAILAKKDADYFYLSETSEAGDLMSASIVKGMWTRVHNNVEKALIKEFDTGGDPEVAAVRHADKIIQMGKDLKQRLLRERLRAAQNPVDDDDDDPTEGGGGGKKQSTPKKDNTVLNFGGSTLDINVGATSANTQQSQGDNKMDVPASTPAALSYALEFIRNGLAVVPLWGVADGICDCRAGTSCPSSGKHPHSKLAWRGVYSASADEKTVRSWFDKDPRINIGIAMGGPLNLICVDVDPRNGGDATFYDLVEAHGDDAFPETYTKLQ